jgi:hypothetical protein
MRCVPHAVSSIKALLRQALESLMLLMLHMFEVIFIEVPALSQF